MTWREGDRGPLTSRFIALPVRQRCPAPGRLRAAERWLLAEWPTAKDEPVKYWLSILPADTPLQRLVQFAKMR